LIVRVTMTLVIDGESVVLIREHIEKITKGGKVDRATNCHIDGEPKLVGEFSAYIAERIPEDTFKMLTDLDHFNGKLHWKERRGILLDLAGEIGTPEGFEDLLNAIGNKTQEGFKKAQKFLLNGDTNNVGYKKERENNVIRINTYVTSMGEYAGVKDSEDITKQRDTLKAEIETLEANETELLNSEGKRQKQTEFIAEMESKKSQRQTELNNARQDTVGLLDEKLDLAMQVTEAKHKLESEQKKLTRFIQDRDGFTDQLNVIREKVTKNLETKIKPASEVTTVCFACNQDLPSEKVAECQAELNKSVVAAKNKHAKELDGLKVDGNATKQELTAAKSNVAAVEKMVAKFTTQLQEAKDHKAQRKVTIDEQLENVEPVDPTGDATWQAFDMKIKEIEASRVDSVVDALTEIRCSLVTKRAELEKLITVLATLDRHNKDSETVKEIENRQIELSRLIADIESQLDQIDEYNAAEGRLIADAVNGMFKRVKFKLFNEKLDKSLDDTCDAMYNGVPYKGLSTGEKIYINIDIVNVLSKHYGMEVVLFIDHAESLKMPIEAESQVIRLVAKTNDLEDDDLDYNKDLPRDYYKELIVA